VSVLRAALYHFRPALSYPTNRKTEIFGPDKPVSSLVHGLRRFQLAICTPV
jgi:hypothetical protein